MPELLVESLPWLPATLSVLVLWLLSPVLDEVGRRRIAVLFVLGAIGLIVIAVQRAGTANTLQVMNPFPVGPEMRSTAVRIETVTAAGWQWPAVAAGFLGILALLTFGGLRLPSRAPSPAARCTLVFAAFVALRLLFEKNAAPQGLCWATGGSIGLPILLAFAGYYAGSRRQGFGSFLGSLLLMALCQRAIVAGFAWFATTRHWGTHLDVGAVTSLNTPLGGERHFGGDPNEKWIWAILVPQMGLWVAITVVAGLILGTIGWLVGRRR
jgi:hypothetical protein